jgi:hypothetical protein
MEPYKRIHTSDPVIEELQDNLSPILSQIEKTQILDGVLLKDQALVAGASTYLSHGLERAPIGYLVTRKRSSAIIHDLQDDNSTARKTLCLVSSADVTIDVWVF